MTVPDASRPFMPGYGTRPANQGSGLLTWSWACEQLGTSRNYWVATVGADGQPHALPVWGVWLGDALWFSCGAGSRKRRNLAHQPRCAVTTQDPEQPVMLQGSAEIIRDRDRIGEFLAATNDKYDQQITADFLDPDRNATVRVRPSVVIGLREADFTGSPTRWTFPG
ncbi:MAG TPA: pyridoxamine 5'-phosphate oxidase family protein [Pseudonocardiaceae bacterium]|jgi:PPOX class probable F420-dependent enzyme